jgi:hypothetical protein
MAITKLVYRRSDKEQIVSSTKTAPLYSFCRPQPQELIVPNTSLRPKHCGKMLAAQERIESAEEVVG